MSNLTALKLPQARADEKLVALLEEMLADAKAGKIHSFAGVVFHRETHHGQRYLHKALNMQGIGAMYLLLNWMTEQWERAPSLPDP